MNLFFDTQVLIECVCVCVSAGTRLDFFSSFNLFAIRWHSTVVFCARPTFLVRGERTGKPVTFNGFIRRCRLRRRRYIWNDASACSHTHTYFRNHTRYLRRKNKTHMCKIPMAMRHTLLFGVE